MSTLYVTPQEFGMIMDWTRLQEWEYVERVLARWPFLRARLYDDIHVRVVYPDMLDASEPRMRLPRLVGRYVVVFKS